MRLEDEDKKSIKDHKGRNADKYQKPALERLFPPAMHPESKQQSQQTDDRDRAALKSRVHIGKSDESDRPLVHRKIIAQFVIVFQLLYNKI